MRLIAFALLLCPMAAVAETAAVSLVATRMIRAQTVLSAEDVAAVEATIPGALTDIADAVGLEARVTLYPGRPVRAGDLGPPALVDRNATVFLAYRSGGLTILAEGRALERAGVGDLLRVMNLASRRTVVGRLGPDGMVDLVPESSLP
jgi:flagella basal body P-ring formation protein FlgA